MAEPRVTLAVAERRITELEAKLAESRRMYSIRRELHEAAAGRVAGLEAALPWMERQIAWCILSAGVLARMTDLASARALAGDLRDLAAALAGLREPPPGLSCSSDTCADPGCAEHGDDPHTLVTEDES